LRLPEEAVDTWRFETLVNGAGHRTGPPDPHGDVLWGH
jgi:hypothetical protein